MLNHIAIRGARVNNLKNIDVDIPHTKLVVFTGLSGSGKSSLAFDTIYAEGHRRFMESLSSFTKQFMESVDRPDVDQIDGLPPTIAIDQRTASSSPRSTVGTATEIYDHLRLLYARIGTSHCPKCDACITARTRQQIISTVQSFFKESLSIVILASLKKNEKIRLESLCDELSQTGFHSVRLDGLLVSMRELATLRIDEEKAHTLDIVIDQRDKADFTFARSGRFVELIKTALELGDGTFSILFPKQKEEHVFTERLVCANCDIVLSELEPRNFSFNNPVGACSACTGLGYLLKFDPDLLIPNKKLTIAQGAIQPLNKIYANTAHYLSVIDAAIKEFGCTIHTPIGELDEHQLTFLLNGRGAKKRTDVASPEFFEGIIPYLEAKYHSTDSDYLQHELEEYMRVFQCTLCNGKRLKPDVLAVTVNDVHIDEVVALPISKLFDFFSQLDNGKKRALDAQQRAIARPIIKEVQKRIAALIDVGLGYVVLDRSMATLSGGEAQRVKLANHISSSLVGVVYVLDEPSIGLHPRDTEKLIATLKALRNNGNTVLVVEHDSRIIASADMVIDVGPRAGKDGGKIIAQGTPLEIAHHKESLTGRYLSGTLSVASPKKLRAGTENGKALTIRDARAYNLKNIDVTIPLGRLIFVTGVSGSGKSTLVVEILSKALLKKFNHTKEDPGPHTTIEGIEHIDKVVVIDQSPIGRTPRSNPVTYTNIFTPIRELFTELPESKMKGFKPGHFSFNVKGGRCETCQGEGMMRIDMRFLSDVYVECRDCIGKRYNQEALEVHYEGLSIADVLDLTVNEALDLFKKHPVIHDKLKTLSDVGLGYIRLGQPAPTLSGGEAQRMKLAAELSRRSTGKTLYILDEPTTGLHFDDIKQLLNILHQLVDKGNTVLIIEHNTDIIKNGDWIIDLGPDGGDAGGYVVATGTPSDIKKCKASWTGKYL